MPMRHAQSCAAMLGTQGTVCSARAMMARIMRSWPLRRPSSGCAEPLTGLGARAGERSHSPALRLACTVAAVWRLEQRSHFSSILRLFLIPAATRCATYSRPLMLARALTGRCVCVRSRACVRLFACVHAACACALDSSTYCDRWPICYRAINPGAAAHTHAHARMHARTLARTCVQGSALLGRYTAELRVRRASPLARRRVTLRRSAARARVRACVCVCVRVC